MAMKWYGPSEGILRGEYFAEDRRRNIPPPQMSRARSYFPHSRSPTESMCSSSSRSSSQESLNIYGSSPETPRLSGLKPQDRLRRIREEFAKQQSKKMEIDEEVNTSSSIQPMNPYSVPSTVLQQHSPMKIDEDVSESVRSVSLRLKRYRQNLPESIPINNKNNINCGYPSLQPWERGVPLSNIRNNSNETWGRKAEKLASTEYKIPRWMLPLLSLKPLRRPHFAQQY